MTKISIFRNVNSPILMVFDEKTIHFAILGYDLSPYFILAQFFIVPLVNQQAGVIRDHTELKVGEFQGSLNVDEWTQSDWDVHFEENQVLLFNQNLNKLLFFFD